MRTRRRLTRIRVHAAVLYWETIASYELDAYRHAWSAVRMEQLNAEVVVIARAGATHPRQVYRARDGYIRGSQRLRCSPERCSVCSRCLVLDSRRRAQYRPHERNR